MSRPNNSRPATRWQLSLPASLEKLQSLMAEYQVSAPTAGLIHARRLSLAALRPELTLTPNSGLREAAGRIWAAAQAKKRIRIHGDYDADGVSATATLVWGLRELGADVHGFIPHRLNEGYGIHPSRIEEHAQAADLLVTVDCGVSNHEEVQSLLDKGVEVIVTDHHSPGISYPKTLVVHPKLTENHDPDLHNLTGAGVAYHLLWAVREVAGISGEYGHEPRHLAPLATLGTIADVAPLIGENRALVRAGLAEFERTTLPGLRALMKRPQVSAREVAFTIAPRINAAGRMGEAEAALELLTTSSPQRAQELAAFLEIKNTERQDIQQKMFEEALHIADPSDPALVITAPHWHAGVMGIVASKLLERYYKPVYIVAQGKGSVRSTPGISAVGGLVYSAGLLKRYGGHPGAAGFALDESNFEALRGQIHEYARTFPVPVPTLMLDGVLDAQMIERNLYDELEQFEPYGEGWRAPQWHLRGLPETPQLIGQQDPKTTLRFHLRGLKAIGFGQRGLPSGPQDMAAEVGLNDYKGKVSLQLQVNALRPAQPIQVVGVQAAGVQAAGVQVAGVQVAGAGQEASAAPPASSPRRLEPGQLRAYLSQLEGQGTLGDVRVYAPGSAAPWWAQHYPAVQALGEDDQAAGDQAAGEVLLCAMPPEETLRRWLPQARLTFVWGKPTLSALQGGAGQSAADYHRWQWAQLYQVLDDQSFGLAVYALLGLPLPATGAGAPQPAQGAAD